jgi:hypothetical protein
MAVTTLIKLDFISISPLSICGRAKDIIVKAIAINKKIFRHRLDKPLFVSLIFARTFFENILSKSLFLLFNK